MSYVAQRRGMGSMLWSMPASVRIPAIPGFTSGFSIPVSQLNALPGRVNALPIGVTTPIILRTSGPAVVPPNPLPFTPTGSIPGIMTPEPTPANPVSVVPVAPGAATPIVAPAPAGGIVPVTSPSGVPTNLAVAGPPPGNYPTNQPYTDPAGNIWTFGPSGWQISTAAAGSSAGSSISNLFSQLTAWLQSNTIISLLPNYGTVAIGAAGLILLAGMFGGGSHRRRR